MSEQAEPWVPKVGDWIQCTADEECGEAAFQVEAIDSRGWYCNYTLGNEIPPDEARPATASEIAAAQLKIEVGDTVEWIYGSMAPATFVVREIIDFIDSPTTSVLCARSEKGALYGLRHCRLISKGKKGQGVGASAQGTGVADCSIQSPKVGACTANPSPCPACSGSVHGPGKISDWTDKPIACPRCQYGKPAPEKPIAKPYHKITESGECVICDLILRSEAIKFNVADKNQMKVSAMAALAKAQAEAKRLGIDE